MEPANDRQDHVDRLPVWNRLTSHVASLLRSSSLLGWFRGMAFGLMHVACFGVFLTGTNVLALSLCGVVYFLQMVGITVGYHRYFSHRTFKTSRAFQFALACLGCSASQRGPIWWAAQHRHHHRTSDTSEDLHSPIAHTFWQSHVAWIFSPQSAGTNEQTVKDLVRYPELRWLDRHYLLPPLSLAALCLAIGGWAGLVWGFFVSSILSHHATFMVNSVCHLWGTRQYATSDSSRNNFFVALITLGEGWHNNHHHYPNSAQQGFRWWECDFSYYLIRLGACLGIVHDVRKVPRSKLLASLPCRLVTSEKSVGTPNTTWRSTNQFECATDNTMLAHRVLKRFDETDENVVRVWEPEKGLFHLNWENARTDFRDA
jgi:stearoyl-CoA desaturase (delta-9 desaturase)